MGSFPSHKMTRPSSFVFVNWLESFHLNVYIWGFFYLWSASSIVVTWKTLSVLHKHIWIKTQKIYIQDIKAFFQNNSLFLRENIWMCRFVLKGESASQTNFFHTLSNRFCKIFNIKIQIYDMNKWPPNIKE